MSQLNCFGKSDFTCDKCGGEFYHKTAYSVARNWEEFDEEYTYCKKCVEVSEYSKLDGRSMNKTGRTYQLGTRVRKGFLEKLKRIAYEVENGGGVGEGFGVLWWGEVKIEKQERKN